MRCLDLQKNGTTFRYIKTRLAQAKIDTSHFTGLRSQLGKPSRNKIAPVDLLVLRASGIRRPACKLRRALLEIGRPYVCEKCGNTGTWLKEKLLLEIDHRNNNRSDDRPENIRFLCPNCHSQRPAQHISTHVAAPHRCRCGKPISVRSLACYKHKRHVQEHTTKIKWPSMETLIRIKRDRKVASFAKAIGVSDNAVHKRIRRFIDKTK